MTTDTETCRASGWGPGTVLVGDEGDGPDAIRLTAVGGESVLAVHVAAWRNGAWSRGRGGERNWTLECRDWRPATPDELAAIAGAPMIAFRPPHIGAGGRGRLDVVG